MLANSLDKFTRRWGGKVSRITDPTLGHGNWTLASPRNFGWEPTPRWMFWKPTMRRLLGYKRVRQQSKRDGSGVLVSLKHTGPLYEYQHPAYVAREILEDRYAPRPAEAQQPPQTNQN